VDATEISDINIAADPIQGFMWGAIGHASHTNFLATKILRPRRSSGLIERPRLLTLLDQAQVKRLTVIKAAAGFGKTSLAIAGAERLLALGHAVAWLSLDEDDNEPAQFLFYVAHVLRQACDGLAKPAIDLIHEVMLVRPNAIVSALINSLAEVESEVFLFLDDYHLLTDPGIRDSVVFLLRHAPSNLHLVLMTRTEPALPLDRWRARDQVLEIDGRALRFDLEETSRFLAQETSGLGQADTRSLLAKTEGWPAMLRIVATMCGQSGGGQAGAGQSGAGQSGVGQSVQDIGQYIRSMSSDTRPIRGYLADLLGGLPGAMVGFLLRISILDRFCAPLCQAVTGLTASHALLQDVAARRMLLVPLDADGTWFRCHPLLRGVLSRRLEAEHAGEVPELHRRAYAWYAAAELWTDAIHHATAVGDSEQAVAWVENCAMALLKRGELLALRAWERLIPPALMKRQIKARLAMAWGMALAVRFDDALRLATEIEQELGNADPKAIESLGCECQTIRSVATALRDDTDAALKLAEASLVRRSSGPWTTNVAANVAMLGYWKAGDLARCYAVPWIALSGDDGSRNVVANVYRLCLRGLVEYDQLRTASAERLFCDALRIAEEHSGASSVAAAMPASLIARLRYDQGRLDEAEALVIDRLPAIDAAGMLECVLWAYLVLSRVALRRGNTERAHALLEQAEHLGNARNWGRLVAMVVLERVRINLGEGHIMRAEAGVAHLDRLARAYPAPVRCAWSEIHDAAEVARAELLAMRCGFLASAAVLRRLHGNAIASERHEPALHLAVRLAAVLCRGNEAAEALALCRQAVLAAAVSGLCQPIADADSAIEPLLSRLHEEMQRCAGRDEQRRFLADVVGRRQATAGSATGSAVEQRGADILSRREQDVLALVIEGQSNKDIARALGIAPETVKSHVKNIFGKLGVVRRAQAVSRALSLGLIRAA
jgi:LuxR family maltose regulon positive regulatory protein